MSYAGQSNIKALKKSKPILHWESTQSVPCGCKTMLLFNQGEEECDNCPTEDASDILALAPCDSSDSDSTTRLEFDEFGEDPWDDSEFATYRCNSAKVSHIPSEPVRNPHDYEEDLDDIIVDCTGEVIGTYVYQVTLDDENIYRPTSVDENIVDLKLSKLAYEGSQGSALHFNLQGHFDAGSQATTIPRKHLLSNYQRYSTSFPCPVRLISADEMNPQYAVGEGTVRIPTKSDPRYVDLRASHTPGIPSIIVSPQLVQEKIGFENYSGYLLETRFNLQSFLFHAMDSRDQKNHITIPGGIAGTLNYTCPIVMPNYELPGEIINVPMNQIVQDFSVMTLSGTGLKLLWHQRLGHCLDEKLANTNKFTDGVPKFTSTHDVMENCTVCLAAKMKYSARGTETTRKAVQPFQGFSIDFAFAGQRSKDKNTAVDFVRYGGETCYVLLVNHFTEKLYGATRISKVPPVSWL